MSYTKAETKKKLGWKNHTLARYILAHPEIKEGFGLYSRSEVDRLVEIGHRGKVNIIQEVPKDFVTVQEAIEILGVTKVTYKSLKKNKVIQQVKFGYFLESDIIKLAEDIKERKRIMEEGKNVR
jgi:hypothetical protein